jgi:hypothetical protein
MEPCSAYVASGEQHGRAQIGGIGPWSNTGVSADRIVFQLEECRRSCVLRRDSLMKGLRKDMTVPKCDNSALVSSQPEFFLSGTAATKSRGF